MCLIGAVGFGLLGIDAVSSEGFGDYMELRLICNVMAQIGGKKPCSIKLFKGT